MNQRYSFRLFRQSFGHPRVFIFILLGTGIIFLTFLTKDNAMEIAISAIASVFIGIGVNNLSSIETHFKDEELIRSRLKKAVQLFQLSYNKIERLRSQIDNHENEAAVVELMELKEMLHVSMDLMQDELNRSPMRD